jgi:ribosome-associated protein YbcJ (S4-like RNA binding protein)
VSRRGKRTARRSEESRRDASEQTFAVRGDYITLGQLLQAAGLVSSGGEAKQWLAAQAAIVNGEPEQRRGRKLRPDDIVQAAGAKIRLVAQAVES